MVHEKKKPFKCDICDYSCSQKGNMKKHAESVHERKKSFKCDICDYSCSQKGTMKKHEKRHLNVITAVFPSQK